MTWRQLYFYLAGMAIYLMLAFSMVADLEAEKNWVTADVSEWLAELERFFGEEDGV